MLLYSCRVHMLWVATSCSRSRRASDGLRPQRYSPQRLLRLLDFQQRIGFRQAEHLAALDVLILDTAGRTHIDFTVRTGGHPGFDCS